jgi:peptide deformylase
VGRRECITVVRVKDAKYALINPEIVEREGKITWEEGCLSIPEIYGDVVRAKRVVVRAQAIDGAMQEIEGTELLGVCMQHEIDHLHGKLFLDHLSFLKRQKALRLWDDEKDKYPDFIRIVVPGEHEPEDDSAHDDERF